MPTSPRMLHRDALFLRQHARYPVYLFSLRAEEIFQVAEVARLARDESGNLVGYQRPAVRRHVRDILAYLNSGEVLFPSALVIAFTGRVSFIPRIASDSSAPGVPGVLEIPLYDEAPKAGYIVDGQQRCLALSQSQQSSLPIPVTAFAADDPEVQREQFIRVNSARPLPRSLVTELLPTVQTDLPIRLESKRAPSLLVDQLAQDETSPFFGLVRRPSTPRSQRKKAVVADTSLIHAIERSLNHPAGALFEYQNVATGTIDMESAFSLLRVYWTEVRDTFSQAWGLPPHESRLMHGVGIQALGQFMDHVMRFTEPLESALAMHARRALRSIEPTCAWTSGVWLGLNGLPWNALQNHSSHVKLLARHLADYYEGARRSQNSNGGSLR